MNVHAISDKVLSFNNVKDIIENKTRLKLSDSAARQIRKCRDYLDQKIENTDEPLYGINTGFGSLYNKKIPKKDLQKLQYNLVRSQACGAGEILPVEIVRLMLFLKIQSLSYGYSGVQLSTVQRLIDFFNREVYPVVYEYGSLGASGDLAPLAHLSLPLIGEGEVLYQGKKFSGEEIKSIMGWKPIQLVSKEGLALLNGTQMMAAYGIWCQYHAFRIMTFSNFIGALSLDAFNGRIDPFDTKVNKIRPHTGQVEVAAIFKEILHDSEILAQSDKEIQDPYSFRCIPPVHGTSLDAIKFTNHIFMNEVNGVNDNPIIFPGEDEIISAGNFHGQPLAIALDYLCIALAELGNISERRTFQLLSGSRGLPTYLTENPGINSGFMIPQYTAASIVNMNKQLSTPVSIDSIVSSNGQEDHVSMGANAATKAYRVVKNLYRILAIELLTAAQALDYRKPLKTSSRLEDLYHNFRKEVSFVDNDKNLYPEIQKSEQFLKSYRITINYKELV